MQITNRGYYISFGLLTAFIYLAAWQILTSSTYMENPDIISAAITFDMTITVALLYYFMVVHKRKTSPIQLVPVLIISTILASFVLPNDQEYFLDWIKYSLIFTEFFVIAYLVIKIRDISSVYQKQTGVYDFTERLNMAVSKVLNSKFAANVISSELSMFYYAVTFNRNSHEAEPSTELFTYHKQNGYSTIFWVILFLVIVEGAGIHLIVSRWSYSTAIILGILNIYAFIFLLADFSAIKKKPIQISTDKLLFRMGLRWKADMPIANIAEIELNPIEKEEKDRDLFDCSTFGSPDIIIHFTKPMVANGIYGFKKNFSKIAFNIDDKSAFVLSLNNKLEHVKTIGSQY